MKLITNSKITTSDFWYDLFDGGYIVPETILENDSDIKRVNKAIETILEFRDAVDEIIEEY